MNTIKIALLATAATFVLAGPSLAQNFQGFGVPNYAAQNTYAPTQERQVSLQNRKATAEKHHRAPAK